MPGILGFIKGREQGATEKELVAEFPGLSKAELARELNLCLRQKQISLYKEAGVIYYKASAVAADDYELMVYNLIKQSGGNGVWIKVIKDTTNMPHNLVGKVLKAMESKRMIKSVKCLKSNRKIYMLYDQVPSDEITGGAWFHDNDVDSECVKKMLQVVQMYLERETFMEDGRPLVPYERNPTLENIMEYIQDTNVLSMALKFEEVKTLVDVLVFDGKAERLVDGEIERYRAV
jgi:DNA-directed RNA polymerase III subunit RPC6